jgi:hypothetical protein
VVTSVKAVEIEMESMESEIWLNDHDVPVMFRIVENGEPIDFILISSLRDAAIAEAHLVPTAKLHQ